ncbi:MAG: FixH [Fibrobacteres bacterium]|nr:FixH [Fibrobacterota bacterium]
MPVLPSKSALPPLPAGIQFWAIALAMVVLLMVGANCYLVWLSSHGQRDLVRADYYDSGLEEDKSIARNAAGRNAGHVDLRRTASGWQVGTERDFPESAVCRARFYRPDDGREDRVLTLNRSADARNGRGLWQGPDAALRRGQWIVNLVWEKNGAPVSETTVHYQAP